MEEISINQIQTPQIQRTHAKNNASMQIDSPFLLQNIPSCSTTPEKKHNHQNYQSQTESDLTIVNQSFCSSISSNENSDDHDNYSEQSDMCLSAISEDADTLQDAYSCIGLIIAIFTFQKKVFTSSGILISNNIILTCTHAFENHEEQYCDYFIFVPGCSNLTNLNKFKKHVFKKEMLLSTSTMNKYFRKEIRRELALIKIEEEYNIQNVIPPIEFDQIPGRSIEIIGYSSADITYNSEDHTIQTKYAQRAILKGQYTKIDRQKHQISYQLVTNPGLSGAPILAKYTNKKGEQVTGIIGIHTHGSKSATPFSKGLLFTKQMKCNFDTFLRKIEQFDY